MATRLNLLPQEEDLVGVEEEEEEGEEAEEEVEEEEKSFSINCFYKLLSDSTNL